MEDSKSPDQMEPREDHFEPERSDLSAPDVSGLFLRLQFVTVWVRDQNRCLRFFKDELEFQVLVDHEFPGQGRWIVVAPPSGAPGLALIVPPEGSPESDLIGKITGISFLTEDVRAVFDLWSKRGVQFPLAPIEPPWGSGQARYAIFQDPDGNRFSLIEFDEATRQLEAERRARTVRLEAERQRAHEISIAKEVQTRLLPQQQPVLRTLEYVGLCNPAREVGGDYYDFLDLGSGRLGLVIADIVGKGMAAALLMANLQANLRSHCATAWDEPERFLRAVNSLFHGTTKKTDYATLFFAQYDDATRRFRYANCGHPPAILLRREGAVERLESTSTVIGLFDQWDCAIEERELAPGDTLVLYTDGATETINAEGKEFGERRLTSLLQEHRAERPSDLITSIADGVRQFNPDDRQDDITLIVATCRDPQ